MQTNSSVDQYIDKHLNWEKELQELRAILQETPLSETIKWGAPVYTFQTKNIVGLGAFKLYVGLWFFQGALLKDEQNVLVNAQEGKTVAMRQWRFNSHSQIDKSSILPYVYEAIENQKLGKSISPKRNKPLLIPEIFQHLFVEDHLLKDAFEQLNLTKKREYIEYIETAKREATRQGRIEKIIPLIKEGKGLNDKYR